MRVVLFFACLIAITSLLYFEFQKKSNLPSENQTKEFESKNQPEAVPQPSSIASGMAGTQASSATLKRIPSENQIRQAGMVIGVSPDMNLRVGDPDYDSAWEWCDPELDAQACE